MNNKTIKNDLRLPKKIKKFERELAKKRPTKKKKPNKNRTEQGKFIKGQSGNPNGRPLGAKNHDGFGIALTRLKCLIGKEKNLKKLEDAFQKAFDNNPLGFYYRFVMPMLPKNVDLGLGDELKDSVVTVVINGLKKNEKS